MRKLFAALATSGLMIALGSGAWAQDEKRGNDKSDQNQDQNQNKDRQGALTIRGTVSGVTAEGELAIDYRTKQLVLVQAAYMTVVGSPVQGSKAGDKANRQDKGKDADADADADADSDAERDNVYVAWISPRTKVYAVSDPKKPDQKKVASLDDLEVGDSVEIQFVPRDETDATPGTNQTEQMRRKHGRNRIYVGDAMAVTILPPQSDDDESPGPGQRDSSKGDSDKSNRDKDK